MLDKVRNEYNEYKVGNEFQSEKKFRNLGGGTKVRRKKRLQLIR